MNSMENLFFGIFLGILLLAGALFLYCFLQWIRKTNKQMESVAEGMRHLAEVFEKSSQMADSITSLSVVNRRLISSTESMTAAVKTFASLILQPHPAGTEIEEREFIGRTPPMPPRPEYDEYAKAGEAEILAQTDEDLTQLDIEAELRRQGIETSQEKIPMPPLDQVNFVDS